MRKKVISCFWLVLVALFMYIPVLILAFYSFTDSTTIGAVRGFSLQNYVTLFTMEELRNMIVGTLLLAVGAAAAASVLGTLGAVGAFYSKPFPRMLMDTANRVPVVNADVVTAFSICILLIVVLGIDKNTFIPLVIGHVVLCTPFVYLAVMPKLRQMDNGLYEAALDLGATPFQALWKIVLPQIIPGVISGFMLSITLSLDDYFVSTYTKPATFDTISTYVFNATRGSQTEIKTALWALSTVIFLVVIIAVVIMNLAAPKQTEAQEKGSHEKRKNPAALLAGLIAAGVLSAAVLPAGAMHAEAAGTDISDGSGESITLRIANWEEYIDEGGWDEDEAIELEDRENTVIFGENSLVEDFEQWYFENYGVRVNVEYSTFGTNEDLYNQLTLGNDFDLVCPSEYMFMKLIAEDRLQPLSESFSDPDREDNYYIRGVSDYIRNIFDSNTINGEPWSRYAAGYMWGTTGIVYNPEKISAEEAAHWALLTDPKYKGKVTVKDNVRDSYFAALGILNEEELMDPEFINSPDRLKRIAEIMNRTDEKTVDEAETILKQIKENAYSFESDSGKADMVTGKVLANYQWSGDAVYTMDQAEIDDYYLAYSVPEECTNVWFDGWVMLRDGIGDDQAKQQAAEAFINFLSRPDNVVRNMYYIGYTSVIAGGDSDIVYAYADWCYGADEEEEDTIEYPLGFFFSGDNDDPDYVITAAADQADRQLYAQYPPEDVLDRAVVMQYFDQENNQRINQMWVNVRCFDLASLSAADWGKIAAAVIIAGAAVLIFRNRDDIFRRRG